LHEHLGDDGEKCGCYSEDSGDDYSGYKHRRYIRCKTHIRRQERASRQSNRHYEAEEKYNCDTERRLKELEDLMKKTKLRHYDELVRKTKSIRDNIVPIKYLYERGYGNNVHRIGSDMRELFNVQKIRRRYYCCKNKVRYYKGCDNKLKDGLEREKHHFILERGWSEEDITIRSYRWIKDNDKMWLMEYKRRLRMEQALKDEADWEVKMLLRM